MLQQTKNFIFLHFLLKHKVHLSEIARSFKEDITLNLKTVHNQLSAIFNHAVCYYDLRSNPAAKAGNMGRDENKEMLFWIAARVWGGAVTGSGIWWGCRGLGWMDWRIMDCLKAEISKKHDTALLDASISAYRD